MAAPVPGRCAFFVERKRRYCKLQAARGTRFCGEHAHAAGPSHALRRMCCPLDPTHTVYEDRLTKHLKKCNAREKPNPVYYMKDINAGSASEEENVEEVSIADRSHEELNGLIEKLKSALEGLDSPPSTEILSHPALQEALTDPKNGNFAFKHLKQQASILGNMESLGLLKSQRCYVEFGAGKGKLSHWIHVALQEAEDVHFLLVERSSTRFKVDGKHKNTESRFDRLQVDIQHLDLNRVVFLREKGLAVIGVGKHVCGAATDLALRCLLGRVPKDEETPPSKRVKLSEEAVCSPAGETESGGELKVSGLAIALCCHHRCDWKHYVGKDFFRQRGLGPVEFGAFRRMASWATCGMSGISKTAEERASDKDDDDDEAEHEESSESVPDKLNSELSAEQRERIGRMCKTLIDHGRLHYLQQRGFKSNLTYYTSKDVSLENVLLTAVPT